MISAAAIAAVAATIVAEFVPEVEGFLKSSNVLAFLTLLIVVDIALRDRRGASSKTKLIANQDAAVGELDKCLASNRKSRVDFLEYAGLTTLPLIRAAVRAQRPMRILVKHPETVEGVQRQRMLTTLDTLYTSVLDGYTCGWEVRCYRLPYSLRARRVGQELLELGWLTPDDRRKTAYGHANPSLLLSPSEPESAAFVEFFERTFTDLWEHADTEPGDQVLARMVS